MEILELDRGLLEVVQQRIRFVDEQTTHRVNQWLTVYCGVPYICNTYAVEHDIPNYERWYNAWVMHRRAIEYWLATGDLEASERIREGLQPPMRFPRGTLEHRKLIG